MAQETSFSAALSVAKSGLSISGSDSKTVDLAGNNFLGDIQNIGLATEALSLGDIGTPGYVYLKNIDPVNFVLIGLVTAVTAGNAFIKLLPGEFAFFPTRQTTIYALADTAACDLEKVIVEL